MELFSFLFEGNEIARCHETFHLYFSMILVIRCIYHAQINANSYDLYEFYMIYFDDKLLEISELDEIDK